MPKTPLFKPLVASSLAVALGVSVAVAQPTITGGSISGITWSEDSGYDTTSTGTITAQTGVTTTLTSNKGIKITNGQDSNAGTLTLDFGSQKNGTKFILDLNNVSSDKAFVGNLTITGANNASIYDGNRRFQGIFGKNFQGNISIDTGGKTTLDNPALTFNNGAKLEGDLTVGYEDTYIVFNGNGGSITGTLTKKSSGGLTIQFDSVNGGTINNFTRQNENNKSGTTNINNLTNITGAVNVAIGENNLAFLNGGAVLGSSITLNGGTLSYGFVENVSANNKTFSLDTSGSKISITGGELIFNGAKSVYFNNGNSNATAGDGTLTLTGGSVKFVVDPSITSANQTSQAIAKGNISTTNASVIFALSNTTNKAGSNPFTNPNATPPTDTYYVDGNITIGASSGLSAFWDDSKGFVGKIATTGAGHMLNFDPSSGLSGKNDVWFDRGTFTTNNIIPSINATSGTSHLVFEDSMIIGNNASSNAISATNGKNIILFKGDSNTIKGNIISEIFSAGANPMNTIISQGNLTFDNGIAIKSTSQATINHYGNAINRFILLGTSSFDNVGIQATSKINRSRSFQRYNAFKFENTTSGIITNLDTQISLPEIQNNLASRVFNVLSFEGNQQSTLTINSINKNNNNENEYTGYTYIGKGFTSGDGDAMTLNSAIFSNGSWKDSSHQANLHLTSDKIFIRSSSNYINVAQLTATTIRAKGSINRDIGYNYVYTNNLNATNIETSDRGYNYINVNGTTLIKGGGRIYMQNQATSNQSRNLLIFNGESVTFGESNNGVNIQINNTVSSGIYNSYGDNTILFGAKQNNIYISELSIVGDGGSQNPQAKTLNTLSFNNDSGNAVNITTMSSTSGNNIIGKGLVDANGGYVTALFGSQNLPTLQNTFSTNFLTENYSAKGTFTFGSITANSGGTNYINVENLTISTLLRANGGNNYVYAGATTGVNTINGSINSSSGTNSIVFSGNNCENTINGGILASGSGTGKNVIQSSSQLDLNSASITAGNGGWEAKNLFDIAGSINFSNSSLAIKADNTGNQNTDKHNIFKFSSTVSGNIGELIAVTGRSNHSKTKNILSFDSSTTNSLTITNINKTLTENNNGKASGYNYIGKNLISGSGSSLSLSFNEGQWNSSNYTANLNLTVSDTIFALRSGRNYINVLSLTAETISNDNGTNYINTSGNFTASTINSKWGGTNNIYVGGNANIGSIDISDNNNGDTSINNLILFGANSQSFVTGNIAMSDPDGTRKNNITLSGDNATLTLQGQTNQITNFTAYATPSNTRSLGYSTLVIDGSQRANSTTIDNVINGSNLVAKFNGNGADKGATLKISAFADSNNTLKAITLGDASTNNTLDLTALANTTIIDAISVKDGQGLNINLKDTTLTTSGWSNAGTSTITVGGANIASANSTLQGGEVTLSELTLQATNGASMTLQNSSTTIDTLTSSSSIGDRLVLGFDSPTITTQTNPVSATINGAVSGSNLTLVFNGGEDRSTSLALNSRDNTFKAIQLGSSGSDQSTHNTLILNNGKTTITDNFSVGNGGNTQALAFTLKDSTELALTGGLATGDNGITTLRVEDATNGATLSGNATIALTNLDMVSSEDSSLTFKNTTTTINTLTSNATDTQINTLIMGEGSSSVSVNNTAKGTKFNLTFNDTTNNGAKTFTLAGGENTIKQVSVLDTATSNTLSVTGGSTTITDAITIASDKNFTLSLSSSTDTQNPSTTLVTLNNTFGGDGTKNVIFNGGVNPADQLNFSTLRLEGASNVLTSVTSNATNAKIELVNGVGATIGNVAITPDSTPDNGVNDGGSLTFAFVGNGNSQVTATGGITVGNGATLGISLDGSGEKAISGNVDLQAGSTLLVDFLNGNSANATITTKASDGSYKKEAISIGADRNSIINFHGTNTGSLNGSGITIAGGNNTINFIGSATMSGVTLSSGTNTINVYGKSSTNKEIVGEIVTSEVGNVTNTINLNDYSTLKLLSSNSDKEGNGSLTSTAHSNTLNFLGEGATLQGGFGADGDVGIATINVGKDDTTTGISGLITGNVSGASIVFKGTLTNEDSSKLTLQGSTNTISSLTTSSNNGILVLDASKNAVSVNVNNTNGMTIEANKSITIALHSEGTNNANFNVANGGITVNGTLGIAISGSGTGNRAITANGGAIDFAEGSTLRVDFLAGSAGTAKLGDGTRPFEIGANKNSIINFYAGSTATLAGGGLVLDGGTNTVNFYGDATLGQITLTSGNNNINVKDGVTAKIESTNSALGSVKNTINLGDNSILQLEAGTGTNNGDGSIVTANTNTLNFEGANATLKGGFGLADGATTGVSASINVKNTGAVITGNVTNANVSFNTTPNSTLTLQGATNTLNALSSTQNITGTVILDASNQEDGVSAEITSAVASNSSVGLKFDAGGNAKTFKFSASGNNLSGVAFDESGSTNNTIAFTNGSNTITNPFSITQGQGLTIALGDDQTDSGTRQAITQISLELTGGFSQEGGSATLRVEGQTTADALISGGEIDVGNLDMVASTSTSLTLKNSSVTIGTLTAQNGSNTLKLDASSNAVETTISNALNGSNLTITLAGADATKTATFNLNGAGNTINTLTLTNTNNTLALNNGLTTIGSGVSVASGQGVNFNLADNASLAFSSTLANAGTTAVSLGNGASLSVANTTTSSAGTSTFTLANNSALAFTQGLSTTGGTTTFTLVDGASGSITGTISNSATTTTTLNSGSSLDIAQSFTSSGGNSTFALADNTALTFAQGLSTTGGATALNLNGNNVNISGDISTSGSSVNTAIALSGGVSGTITGNIRNDEGATTTLTYSGNNTSLTLKNGTQGISTLTLGAGSSTNTLNLSNQARTTIGNDLTLDNSKNLNVNIDETSSLTLANVTTSSGALRVNGEGSLTTTSLKADTASGSNIINVGTLTINNGLTATKGAQNTITADILTISGNISADSNSANTNKNIITANTATFSGNITSGDNNGGWLSQNFITINDSATFSGNTIAAKQGGTNSNTARTNSFQFNGQVNGTIAELTSAPRNEYYGRTKNILSFNNNAVSNLKITDINKESSLGSNPSGYVYIGANIETKSVENKTFDLVLNLDDSNWSNANFQASNLTLTIQNLNAKKGKNYINVGTLYVGDNSASGSINASDGGVNNIALGKDSKIKGNIASSGNGANNIVIQGSNATLTLEGKDTEATTHSITTLNANGANTTLVLDNSNVTSGAMTTTIGTLNNGANLTATLKGGGSSKEATLSLNDGALKALALGEGSTGNILDLSNATSMSIANQVNVGKGQDLTIKLKNTTLALNGGLSNNGGTSTIALEGTDSASATLTGGTITLSNITRGATSNTLTLNNAKTTITSALDTTSGNSLALGLGSDSTLIFGSSTNTITSLSSNGGLVDLSQGVKPQTPYAMARGIALASNGASARNTLTINDTFTGTATFKLYASKTESDRVEFGGTQTAPYNADTDTQPTTPSGVAIISITGGNDVFSITESDNVVVATRVNDSVDVVGGESYIGGAKVGVTIGAKSDDENAFIIKNAIELEADPVYQEVASSALAVNYDLYLANFNSLNKRMGELRNTQDSNGVWARVFGGAMSNDFGAGSKTQYVTAQAGYDYSLSVGDNARNFIGIAVAYGTSDTKGNASYASSSNNAGLSLDKVSSNMVEVGLYNSYVADSGWYNDTILKFDYIMSDFSLSNDPSTMSSTSNLAMVLSDEFGYRYSFGVSEKGSWYIDPQAEFAFGYFNQSDFNRAVDSLTNIKASQDAILTLRSRIGATLGKKFNTEKGFASLYVGASYEYDYIEGGNSGVSTRDGGLTTQLDKVESNGRAVLNVGSNIELTKGARLYIDVEKSFGDKQRTFMQFNLGARYSF